MTTISACLRHLVIQRASNRCEYCGLSGLGGGKTAKVIHGSMDKGWEDIFSELMQLACGELI